MMLDQSALARLKEDLGGDNAIVAELADSLGTEAPQLLAAGKAAAAAADAAACQRAFHTLKSTAATFGLADLAEASRKIEQSARNGAIPDGATLAAVEALWPPAWQALNAALGRKA